MIAEPASSETKENMQFSFDRTPLLSNKAIQHCYLSLPLGTTELQIRQVESSKVQTSHNVSVIPLTDRMLLIDKEHSATAS